MFFNYAESDSFVYKREKHTYQPCGNLYSIQRDVRQVSTISLLLTMMLNYVYGNYTIYIKLLITDFVLLTLDVTENILCEMDYL